jgi:hypothetical protein
MSSSVVLAITVLIAAFGLPRAADLRSALEPLLA